MAMNVLAFMFVLKYNCNMAEHLMFAFVNIIASYHISKHWHSDCYFHS